MRQRCENSVDLYILNMCAIIFLKIDFYNNIIMKINQCLFSLSILHAYKL